MNPLPAWTRSPPTRCWSSFRGFTRNKKLMILLVTHDLPLVRKHAQQVIWLHEGKCSTARSQELLTPERMAEIFELEIG